jgi:hypothetical protein
MAAIAPGMVSNKASSSIVVLDSQTWTVELFLSAMCETCEGCEVC